MDRMARWPFDETSLTLEDRQLQNFRGVQRKTRRSLAYRGLVIFEGSSFPSQRWRMVAMCLSRSRSEKVMRSV